MNIAQFICDHIPGVDMFRMLGSGTETCMAAIHLARLATGKKNIIKMGGACHGWIFENYRCNFGFQPQKSGPLEAA